MAGAVSIEVHLLWVVDGSPKDPPPALCNKLYRTVGPPNVVYDFMTSSALHVLRHET
jgi:hypothetical protein